VVIRRVEFIRISGACRKSEARCTVCKISSTTSLVVFEVIRMKRILLSSALSLVFPLVSAQAQFCVARDGTLKAANAANGCARGLRPYVAPISNVTVGVKGDKGDRGEKGDQGEKGDPGYVGAQGPEGIAGVQGERGEAGIAGPQGVKGDKGDVGPQGIRGATGATGPQGMKGVTGATGSVGPMGAVGPQGDPGAPSFFPPSDLVSGIAKFNTLQTNQDILFTTTYSGRSVSQGSTGYGVSKATLMECGKFFITRLYCNTSGYKEKITAKVSEVSLADGGLRSKEYFSVPITSTALHMGFSVPYFIDLTTETYCALGNQVALHFEADSGRYGGWPVACEVDVVAYK
jgi:hypothetical protein